MHNHPPTLLCIVVDADRLHQPLAQRFAVTGTCVIDVFAPEADRAMIAVCTFAEGFDCCIAVFTDEWLFSGYKYCHKEDEDDEEDEEYEEFYRIEDRNLLSR